MPAAAASDRIRGPGAAYGPRVLIGDGPSTRYEASALRTGTRSSSGPGGYQLRVEAHWRRTGSGVEPVQAPGDDARAVPRLHCSDRPSRNLFVRLGASAESLGQAGRRQYQHGSVHDQLSGEDGVKRPPSLNRPASLAPSASGAARSLPSCPKLHVGRVDRRRSDRLRKSFWRARPEGDHPACGGSCEARPTGPGWGTTGW